MLFTDKRTTNVQVFSSCKSGALMFVCVFFLENPQTQKEENQPIVETDENTPKASQDAIENVDNHSRSSQEKTIITSNQETDEVKATSENVENTPETKEAIKELSENVEQTAIEKSTEIEKSGKESFFSL